MNSSGDQEEGDKGRSSSKCSHRSWLHLETKLQTGKEGEVYRVKWKGSATLARKTFCKVGPYARDVKKAGSVCHANVVSSIGSCNSSFE